jgi:hypothetical protein
MVKILGATANIGRSSDVKAITGKEVRLLDIDVWDLAMKNTSWNRDVYAHAIRELHSFGNGGVVTLDWHMRACDIPDDVDSMPWQGKIEGKKPVNTLFPFVVMPESTISRPLFGTSEPNFTLKLPLFIELVWGKTQSLSILRTSTRTATQTVMAGGGGGRTTNPAACLSHHSESDCQ